MGLIFIFLKMFFRGPWVLAFQTMTLWSDDDIGGNVTGSSK